MMALDLNLEGAEGPEGVAGRKRVVGSVEGRPSRGRGTAGTGVLEGATVVAVAGNGAQSATQTVTCRPASAPSSASVHVASPSSPGGREPLLFPNLLQLTSSLFCFFCSPFLSAWKALSPEVLWLAPSPHSSLPQTPSITSATRYLPTPGIIPFLG